MWLASGSWFWKVPSVLFWKLKDPKAGLKLLEIIYQTVTTSIWWMNFTVMWESTIRNPFSVYWWIPGSYKRTPNSLHVLQVELYAMLLGIQWTKEMQKIIKFWCVVTQSQLSIVLGQVQLGVVKALYMMFLWQSGTCQGGCWSIINVGPSAGRYFTWRKSSLSHTQSC